jgi:hypothetical protein
MRFIRDQRFEFGTTGYHAERVSSLLPVGYCEENEVCILEANETVSLAEGIFLGTSPFTSPGWANSFYPKA